MGCSGCSIGGDGTPKGCGDKGHCTSGRCNKMNTHDWLSNMSLDDPLSYEMIEVSFKKGARKDFYRAEGFTRAVTGDMVVVESSSGYDVGRISLMGELVRLQMKKKRYPEDRVINRVIRKANQRDLEKLEEARSREHDAMVRARAIARTLDLEMKIGDVEFQGDNRKATFYYTADGRIDFRELVRNYANEFRVKIEMRQIGSRQESARIGGLGPCGRELCCSTWLSNFKSVSTAAARYQNLAINQTKLSGQCGRLKCCLNYELDTYMDALKGFPQRADILKTQQHAYELIKRDIFKGIMYYVQIKDGRRGHVIGLDKERVKTVLQLNKKDEYPDELVGAEYATMGSQQEDLDFEDVTGQIELPQQKPRRGKGRRKGRRNQNRTPRNRVDQKGGDTRKQSSSPNRPKDGKPRSSQPRKKRPKQ